MSYPYFKEAETPEIGRKQYEEKVKEIKEFIDKNHRDQWGNLTDEFYQVLEDMGFEYNFTNN